jgi:hypothetical protein
VELRLVALSVTDVRRCEARVPDAKRPGKRRKCPRKARFQAWFIRESPRLLCEPCATESASLFLRVVKQGWESFRGSILSGA